MTCTDDHADDPTPDTALTSHSFNFHVTGSG